MRDFFGISLVLCFSFYFFHLSFQFAANASQGAPGLPGRVFLSGRPEWSPNVQYYSSEEYLRANYAARYDVRGTLAAPVFKQDSGEVIAVLEIISMGEELRFDPLMEIICRELQVTKVLD